MVSRKMGDDLDDLLDEIEENLLEPTPVVPPKVTTRTSLGEKRSTEQSSGG